MQNLNCELAEKQQATSRVSRVVLRLNSNNNKRLVNGKQKKDDELVVEIYVVVFIKEEK